MIRSQVETQKEDSNFAYAGKAIIITPHPDDPKEAYELLISVIASSSEIVIDDVDNIHYLREKAVSFAEAILNAERSPFGMKLAQEDGIYLKATQDEITVSIPGAQNDLDAEAIVRRAESALEQRGLADPDLW